MMRGNRAQLSIFPAGLEAAAVAMSVGVDLTFNRVTYVGIFNDYIMAVALCIAGALLSVALDRRMALLVPLSGLSFLFPTAASSALLLALSWRTRVGSWVKWPVLAAASAGFGWSLMRIWGDPVNALAVPIDLLEQGLAPLVPALVVLSVVPAVLSDGKARGFYLPPWAPWAAALGVSVLPMLEQVGRGYVAPETVDWIYYYRALLHPTVGWFLLSRPAYIGLLYPFSKVFGAYEVSIAQFPFLALFYTFSAYYLAKSWKRDLALPAALLAAVSPMLLTFLYSGLQANLFSISVMFLALANLLKGRWKYAAGLSYLSLTSHVYAWAQLQGATLIYAAWKWWRGELDPKTRNYVLATSAPFVAGLALIGTGFYAVPLAPLNPLALYRSLEFQFAILSWGSANAFLYYIFVYLGNRKVPGLLASLYVSSVVAMFFVGTAQNLLIDLPLFVPVAAAMSELNRGLRNAVLLAMVSWALVMALASAP
ncbi:hypothetical protein HS1genome_1615 [Sulfodiicoccus acidiphilus]|uniref:Glycosyltransferase RgtA/B/C/D-like domain-containing protein n=1 Tax=Sulfodiicoccus acidiphilus TaxID=1670455 RepID=A0A348B4X4_9CREN|nr:hypothetical protein [Sulfodiicoccus acidiphilus]BBD73226.1 hypothetical protein HS1genome_1615 [Sulfodiicoccus acidiphilus]GGT89786.1 hypothetical protein GCM10007116_04540 [Sulfodiicoccus acidiphilus]